MPNIKSAKKRVQVAERNRQRNVAYKSAIRTALKRVHEALQKNQDKTEIASCLSKTYSLIDRAVLKGILHKNTGARYKARVSKSANQHSAA